MLLAVMLGLTPQAGGDAPAELGYAAHAWLLGQLGDGALAARLHPGASGGDSAPRPFTCSNLLDTGQRQRGRVTLSPGQVYRLRLTALTAEVAQALEACLPAVGETVALDRRALTVRSVATAQAEDPWAGRASYAALMDHYLRQRPAPDRAALLFASPTLFHRVIEEPEGDDVRRWEVDVPLPLPERVYASYAQRWNAFAPQPAPAELEDYIARWVAVGRYAAETSFVSFRAANKGGHLGFCGQATFRFRREDDACRRWLALLGAYAFWCGTGYRTADGFGQTRPVRDAAPRQV